MPRTGDEELHQFRIKTSTVVIGIAPVEPDLASAKCQTKPINHVLIAIAPGMRIVAMGRKTSRGVHRVGS